MATLMEITATHPDLKWWSKETIAVVTGANKGIGFAIARRLAELGLTVVLTARDATKGRAAVSSLRAQNLNLEFRQLDITDRELIHSFARWLRKRFGGLDILVNNAGVSFNSIHTNSVDNAEKVITTNFRGPKLLIEALLPLFRRSSTVSRILNVSSRLGSPSHLRNSTLRATIEEDDGTRLTDAFNESMVSRFLDGVRRGTWEAEGWPKVWTDYAVSKLALNVYSRLLARRLQGSGISVNCYCPGFTRTDMTGGIGSHSVKEVAKFGVELVLMDPDELPTGMFFKLTAQPRNHSKL